MWARPAKGYRTSLFVDSSLTPKKEYGWKIIEKLFYFKRRNSQC
jgi:hypothetical protein